MEYLTNYKCIIINYVNRECFQQLNFNQKMLKFATDFFTVRRKCLIQNWFASMRRDGTMLQEISVWFIVMDKVTAGNLNDAGILKWFFVCFPPWATTHVPLEHGRSITLCRSLCHTGFKRTHTHTASHKGLQSINVLIAVMSKETEL